MGKSSGYKETAADKKYANVLDRQQQMADEAWQLSTRPDMIRSTYARQSLAPIRAGLGAYLTGANPSAFATPSLTGGVQGALTPQTAAPASNTNGKANFFGSNTRASAPATTALSPAQTAIAPDAYSFDPSSYLALPDANDASNRFANALRNAGMLTRQDQLQGASLGVMGSQAMRGLGNSSGTANASNALQNMQARDRTALEAQLVPVQLEIEAAQRAERQKQLWDLVNFMYADAAPQGNPAQAIGNMSNVAAGYGDLAAQQAQRQAQAQAQSQGLISGLFGLGGAALGSPWLFKKPV